MKELLIFLSGFALVAVFIGNAVTSFISWHLFDFLLGAVSCGLGVYFKYARKAIFLPYALGFGIAFVIGIVVLLLQG